MDSIIEAFHIDIRLLIAQSINFAIVFLVLYFFVLKPLMKVMQARTKKIEKGIDDAKKIEERLAKTEDEYLKRISRAKKEASAILEKTSAQTKEKKDSMIKDAREEIGQIINQEKNKIKTEKAKILKEIKAEVADLVVSSVKKVLGRDINKQKNKEIVKDIIKNK